MAQFHREIGKLFASYSNKITGNSPVQYVPSPPTKGKVRRALSSALMPVWFKFFRGPLDRWNLAVMAKYLRDHGLMYDDLYSDKEPVFARALELLPPDIQAARFRRLMRGVYLNHLRMYLPVHEQNYDPFIPYMAPYVEEAKFQLQEEEELLGYHMWEGVWYSGGVTGFGDKEPGEHFLLALPNLYGAGGSPMQTGGKHFSTRAAAAARARLATLAEKRLEEAMKQRQEVTALGSEN
ncbi:putative Ubiquinol-cytochrome c reductase complex 14 kDa protein [Neospora caninum Liverpool]|uniref:Putative Ubiquinol-cytochrome c reductase complex 14 kDa protein n=1 Tax=Neospora caninum (strain Liverpool) TaxID=572307 RepID=F0VBR2_NEOCL|nr:putative Ubiquinol-cytochrome c reductase complex 14 kDa protein [Neospora caninum Liverpool]CBZ51046.1 putative Ubiquinol-cytochrome c reductase complex 14 kDa protein [Neospora caninum Liverpool]CEL68352.1 TPA: Ubiquinol-cytochrome c reductase complex 14 kDa protein, putative [Neospora caninum Liverpool]|eukprot:XP_003881079.1 putative Ubiquinol-cytochrome c reductase complex 14 kDa protein [Neospora caninum Liverpool]